MLEIEPQIFSNHVVGKMRVTLSSLENLKDKNVTRLQKSKYIEKKILIEHKNGVMKADMPINF